MDHDRVAILLGDPCARMAYGTRCFYGEIDMTNFLAVHWVRIVFSFSKNLAFIAE